ncbi:MAG: tetratricopeptide repeat protein [bacterium]
MDEEIVFFKNPPPEDEEGRLEKEIKALESMVLEAPDCAGHYYNLGTAYEKIKEIAKALTCYETVLKMDRGNIDAAFALASIYLDLDKVRLAWKYFYDILKRDPGHGGALYKGGVCCNILGMRNNALKLWKNYLSLNPDSRWSDEIKFQLRNIKEANG